MDKTKKPNFTRIVSWVILIAGIVGLFCSLILVYDQVKIWQNPSYQPTCSLNPVVSCGSVISSNTGHIFGMPAPFLGLLTFPILITLGLMLVRGVRFKKQVWLLIEAGSAGGFLFATWLFFISVYQVNALCPFCIVTDVVVFTALWYVSLHNIEQGFIRLPVLMEKIRAYVLKHHLDILLIWFLLVFIFIMHHFWYYYGQFF
ncbi:MAG TPA: vitamin K epoxide reductase family protein [Patescibacteria group bacterium]|jgi:uncharacterized membrane protein|nr:vitamin K epoxide reductase family protein [Patescibacteria group bacterium]